jgi:membrane-associated phospholipid phosphatase
MFRLGDEAAVPSYGVTVWRHYRFMVLLAVLMSAATITVAAVYDLPIRDPDGYFGKTFVRLPAIVLACVFLDIAPRAIRRAARVRDVGPMFVAVARERWTASHMTVVAVGLTSWYIIYVAFRNLKSFVPFVNDRLFDAELARLDRWFTMGYDPAGLLHEWLGTGLTSHFMSFVYIAWIAFVPASLAAALVWTRNAAATAWYVTAIATDWVLGAILYYLVPSVGPIYADPRGFGDLAATYNSWIQVHLWAYRADVLADPNATGAMQTIAAFASLHVGISVTAFLISLFVDVPTWVRQALGVFLVLTVICTVYLGWHYVVDVIGGVALGAAAVWVAAMVTGNHIGLRPKAPEVVVPAEDRQGMLERG